MLYLFKVITIVFFFWNIVLLPYSVKQDQVDRRLSQGLEIRKVH